jgi:hypothetical protein
MTCWPVSARVGNVKNNDPSLLVEPIAALDANSPPHGKKPGVSPGRAISHYLSRLADIIGMRTIPGHE